jgi:hypothetical protein
LRAARLNRCIQFWRRFSSRAAIFLALFAVASIFFQLLAEFQVLSREAVLKYTRRHCPVLADLRIQLFPCRRELALFKALYRHGYMS